MNVGQSCLTLCDPMDYTVHASLQARILEWVAFPFFRVFSNPGKIQVSHIAGDFLPAEAQRKPKNTGVGSLSLLQWIFLNQTGVSCIAGRIFTNWAIIHENLSFLSLISLLTLVQKALILMRDWAKAPCPFSVFILNNLLNHCPRMLHVRFLIVISAFWL